MNEAMCSLYGELLREARQYRVLNSVLFRLHKKMEKAKRGEVDFSEIIIPLIREIEKAINKNTRGRNRKEGLFSMIRKRTRFSKLRKEMIYR